MGQSLSSSITVVSDTATAQVLRADVVYNSTGGVSDTSNDFSVSSSQWSGRTGSIGVSIPTGGGSQTLYSQQITVNKVYGSTQNVGISAALTGINYWGASQIITAASSHTVPARAVTAPTATGQPSVSDVEATTATAQWAAPSDWGGNDTGDYNVQTARDSGFTVSPVTGTVLDSTTAALVDLLGNTTHWVRSRAFNSAGSGPWGTARSFLTKPSKATGLTATGITPVGVTLGCVAPAGGAATYRLQVAADSGFTTIVHESTTGGLSRTITGLTPGTQYWYRWLAENASGNIGYTEPATFTTQPGLYVGTATDFRRVLGVYLGKDGAWVPVEVRRGQSGTWRQ